MTDEHSRCFKVDMHVHSRFSMQPANWFLRKMGFNESYSEPIQIYNTARQKGMSAVTISDHDTIEGAQSIAHLPDVFISEEISAVFPEDGFSCHILAFDITPSHHQEIQRAKANIYDLTRYLKSENILHAIAHPLFTGNGEIRLEHFEKMLLLFSHLEINGARNNVQNQAIEFVIQNLSESDLARIADKHGIEPENQPDKNFWQKFLIGGSDDHSGLNIARTHTITPNDKTTDATTASILKSIRTGRTQVKSTPPTPYTFAHNLYSIGFQHYKERLQLERLVKRDRVLAFLNRLLTTEPFNDTGMWLKLVKILSEQQDKRRYKKAGANASAFTVFKKEAREILKENNYFKRNRTAESCTLSNTKENEEALFDFSRKITDSAIKKIATNFMDGLNKGEIFTALNLLSTAASLYTALGPYFAAYSLFARDKLFSKKVIGSFCHDEAEDMSEQCIRVAHFTDTFFEVNGVATTLQQQARMAEKMKKHLKIITCSKNNEEHNACIKNFNPIGSYSLPEYPEQEVFIPPFIEILDYCYHKEFNQIHAATPGFMGLSALAVSKILNLPLHGTYHTAFPEYARFLTGDKSVEAVVEQYMIWFYNQCDVVFTPSLAVGDDLKRMGIKQDKIVVYPRGIDTHRFNPLMRNGYLKKKYDLENGLKILYVGRISKEKNIDILAKAFKELSYHFKDVHLVLVGDGPFKSELEKELEGTQTLFTGHLHGDALSAVYASCDLFVFPSTTDTFGNVVLEAQASGLPVVVTDSGGPKENIIPGETGVVVNAVDPSGLAIVLTELLNEPEKLKIMGMAARKYSEKRSFESAFNESWKLYARMSASSAC